MEHLIVSQKLAILTRSDCCIGKQTAMLHEHSLIGDKSSVNVMAVLLTVASTVPRANAMLSDALEESLQRT